MEGRVYFISVMREFYAYNIITSSTKSSYDIISPPPFSFPSHGILALSVNLWQRCVRTFS